MEFYPWVVFVHVAAAFLFVMGHGASMWVSDQIRRERDPTRITGVCSSCRAGASGSSTDRCSRSSSPGIVAGIMGGHFGRGWIWAAIVVLVVDHRADVRAGVALLRSRPRGRRDPRVRDAEGRPGSDARLGRGARGLVDSRRPDVIGLVGVVGLLILLWLMMFKPF